jgi:hypothetical protein
MCPDPLNPVIDSFAILIGIALIINGQWLLLAGFLIICLLCWIFCGRIGFGIMGMMGRSSRYQEWKTGKIEWYRMGSR